MEENLAHSLVRVGTAPVTQWTKVVFCYQIGLALSKHSCKYKFLPQNFLCQPYILEYFFFFIKSTDILLGRFQAPLGGKILPHIVLLKLDQLLTILLLRIIQPYKTEINRSFIHFVSMYVFQQAIGCEHISLGLLMCSHPIECQNQQKGTCFQLIANIFCSIRLTQKDMWRKKAEGCLKLFNRVCGYTSPQSGSQNPSRSPLMHFNKKNIFQCIRLTQVVSWKNILCTPGFGFKPPL